VSLTAQAVASGTTALKRQDVASIRERGLCAKYFGDSYQGFGQPYLTLFRNKFNAALPGREVVITFHVPHDPGRRSLLPLTHVESPTRCSRVAPDFARVLT